ALARDAFWSGDDHFAGFDFTEVGSVNQVKSASFRGKNVAKTAILRLHASEGERTESMGIARDQNPILGEKHERKRALKLKERFAKCSGKSAFARSGDQVQNYFRVARSLEDGSFAFEVAAKFGGVSNVAVVRDRDFSLVASNRKRLRVHQNRIARGGVARVA